MSSNYKKGIFESALEHDLGAAGWKVMTLDNKIKIELLLKNQDLSEMLNDINLSYSTFNRIKREKPNDKTYFLLAEYFGLDVNELKKLPITRDEVLETIDDVELYIKDNVIVSDLYGVLEEAYYSDWFHGNKREEFIEQRELEEMEAQAKLQELRENRKQIRDVLSKFEEDSKPQLSILMSARPPKTNNKTEKVVENETENITDRVEDFNHGESNLVEDPYQSQSDDINYSSHW